MAHTRPGKRRDGPPGLPGGSICPFESSLGVAWQTVYQKFSHSTTLTPPIVTLGLLVHARDLLRCLGGWRVNPCGRCGHRGGRRVSRGLLREKALHPDGAGKRERDNEYLRFHERKYTTRRRICHARQRALACSVAISRRQFLSQGRTTARGSHSAPQANASARSHLRHERSRRPRSQAMRTRRRPSCTEPL